MWKKKSWFYENSHKPGLLLKVYLTSKINFINFLQRKCWRFNKTDFFAIKSFNILNSTSSWFATRNMVSDLSCVRNEHYNLFGLWKSVLSASLLIELTNFIAFHSRLTIDYEKGTLWARKSFCSIKFRVGGERERVGAGGNRGNTGFQWTYNY